MKGKIKTLEMKKLRKGKSKVRKENQKRDSIISITKFESKQRNIVALTITLFYNNKQGAQKKMIQCCFKFLKVWNSLELQQTF